MGRRLSRRRFLAGAGAAAATVAAGAAACTSDDDDGSKADRTTTVPDGLTTGTPNPKGLDAVEHVVILMQENRSFDQYFGTMTGVRGFADPVPVRRSLGATVLAQPWESKVLWPYHADPATTLAGTPGTSLPHTWPDAHDAWNGGRWDGWTKAKTPFTMGHFTGADLAFHHALAGAFTICDRNFCSTLAGTNPNRLHLWTGTTDADAKAGGPALFNDRQGVLAWTTYPERLQQAGVSWQVYQEEDDYGDNPLEWFPQFMNAPETSPLWARGVQFQDSVLGWFEADVAAGKLPQVSWIVAPTDDSEHPGPSSPWQGGEFSRKALQVLADHPDVWAKTIFILNYDENDGFFDHVPPPFPPQGTPGEVVDGRVVGLGPRVPLIVASPWSTGGWVCSETFDHTSVIRLLETWLGVEEPNISAWRREVCGDLTSAFDFSTTNVAFPKLPSEAEQAAAVATRISEGLPAAEPPADGGALPEVETGSRPQRALPYRPAASGKRITDGYEITLANPKADRSVTFEVYALTADGSTSTSYVVAPDAEVAAPLTFDTAAALDVHGPNGFLRTFEGLGSAIAAEVRLERSADDVVLVLDNTAGDAETVLHVAWSVGGPAGDDRADAKVTLGAGKTAEQQVRPADGWYDVTVTADDPARAAAGAADVAWARRLAGHVDTGHPGVTGVTGVA